MKMNFKQALVVRTDIGMGKGKTAAQASHASLLAVEKTMQKHPEWVNEWKKTGQTKIVLKVNSEKELLDLFESTKKMLPSALVKDAGHTQVHSGTITCLGIGPAPENKLDQFTGKLKLL